MVTMLDVTVELDSKVIYAKFVMLVYQIHVLITVFVYLIILAVLCADVNQEQLEELVIF